MNSFFKVAIFVSCILTNISKAAEIRAYIQDIDSAKKSLQSLGAMYKGTYIATDYMYEAKDAHWDLNQEFIRLRIYEKTNWDQKKYVLVHKKTLGALRKMLMHKEFDLIDQAEQDLDEYTLLFSFHREGWQYSLNDMQIFVEDIEYLNPTIEIVASNKDQIDDLFANLSIISTLKYSVPYTIQQILKHT